VTVFEGGRDGGREEGRGGEWCFSHVKLIKNDVDL